MGIAIVNGNTTVVSDAEALAESIAFGALGKKRRKRSENAIAAQRTNNETSTLNDDSNFYFGNQAQYIAYTTNNEPIELIGGDLPSNQFILFPTVNSQSFIYCITHFIVFSKKTRFGRTNWREFCTNGQSFPVRVCLPLNIMNNSFKLSFIFRNMPTKNIHTKDVEMIINK